MVSSLLFVAMAVAGETDIRHPRAPDQPLPIKFTPWFCTACVKAKMIEAPAKELQLMSMPAERLLEKIGVKRSWIIVESPNFLLLSTLKGVRVRAGDSRFVGGDLNRLKEIFPGYTGGSKGGYVTSHQRAHLYHIRLERIHAHFAALTGNKKKFLGMGGRYQVYLFDAEEPYRALAEKVIGRAHNKKNYLVRAHVPGEHNYYVMGTTTKLFKSDRALNSIVAHQTGHMLANGHRNFVRVVWGFLEAGAAHYYERLESVQHNYFCLMGVDFPAEFVRGNWRKKIRHLVYRKKDPSLGGWCETLQPHQMSGVEHALAWSIFEWLVTTDPVRLGKLMDKTKDTDKKPTAEQSIEDVFGVSPYVLHDRWRRYVLKNYK